ncbi:MAG: tRNA uridine-5-carboxymethylaminomethyl(34) synthesis GTPase MnmE [Rhodospirillales bacterium]|nr:tRNA uridine-5-carboxymethylaminomethyl(34) synthesis GTPase MnmE [Rhodospirillales bacterium]
MDDNTIFSLSSGGSKAGVAVIRVSGVQARDAVEALAGSVPAPRLAALRALTDPDNGEVLDRGLVLWFPAPGSFTGEDVVEFQVHGGRAVVSAVLGALGKIPGLRTAEPGEFTRRAFDHGKLDLTEVEGLADLVNSETENQRRQALWQLEGALGALYESWRSGLLGALAHLEADLEFPDDELGDEERSVLRIKASKIARQIDIEIADHLNDQHRGERMRDGVYVAILGAPNVGKSSLLNALARRDAAIVSDTAGTTRDVIEVALDLGGNPVILADTAGLREFPEGALEREGMLRTRKRAAQADLKVVLCEASGWPEINKQTSVLIDETTYVVANKIDCAANFIGTLEESPNAKGARGLWALSATTGEGIEEFLEALTLGVGALLSAGATPSLTRHRHREALEKCRSHLGRFGSISMGTKIDATELAAEDLRLATRAIGRITGRVDVEDLLDVVFADFCIGK